jgi:four helix bundle protein
MIAGAQRRRFFFVSDFKKLHVWQKAHALSLCVDRVSKQIRGGRYASLRSQIFRAATSIPANIAEGRRQESEKEFARFLRYALNSSSELEYHLILAHDTKVISEEDFLSLVTQTIRVRKMLYALLKRLSDTDRTPPAPACAHHTARPEPTAGTPTALGR